MMNKKLIVMSSILATLLLSANVVEPTEKINNLGKGYANLIVKEVTNYQYSTNFDLCYRAVNMDFEKGNKIFYTTILKGVNNPELKDSIITICQDTLQNIRIKNHTTLRGTLK